MRKDTERAPVFLLTEVLFVSTNQLAQKRHLLVQVMVDSRHQS